MLSLSKHCYSELFTCNYLYCFSAIPVERYAALPVCTNTIAICSRQYLCYNYHYGLAPVARLATRIEVAGPDVFGSGQLVGCIVARVEGLS